MKTAQKLYLVFVVALLSACGDSTDKAAPTPAAGIIDQFEIRSVADAYGNTSFGSAGAYQLVTGIVHGKLHPAHPANAGIVDLNNAPVGADGYVSYTTDVAILRPKNAAQAKRVLFYDVVNRGSKAASTIFNSAGAGFAAGQQGNGFLLNQGYTMVWSGWQGDIAQSGNGAVIGTSFPVAAHADGSPITGMNRDEFVLDNMADPVTLNLSYPAVSLNQAQVNFNVRSTWQTAEGMSWNSPSTAIPATSWRYLNDRQIQLTRPAGMDAGAIYSFVYPARNPIVMGIGFAAVRDLISFLRYDAKDARGNPNPLNDFKQAPCLIKDAAGVCVNRGNFDVAIGEGFSQSGRFLRDFLWQGFNDDARGHKVFDGLYPLVAGARRTFTNFRFGQPGRFSRQHEDHFQPGDQFPFAYATIQDPLTGVSDGLLAKCTASGTCPKVINADGSFEFWAGRASLNVTDGAGRDIAIPNDVRLYLVPGAGHGVANGVGTEVMPAQCQYLSSPVRENAPFRAGVRLLENWLVAGIAPPPSNVGSIAERTLVPPIREQVGFPDLSVIGVNFTPVQNPLSVTTYVDAIPSANLAKAYEVLVPATDADGNEKSGIRVPELSVPLATYAGWNVRKVGFAPGEACLLSGATIPFGLSAAERRGDPRPALLERYGSKTDYVGRVQVAAQSLVSQRFLLQEDVAGYVSQAQAVTVLP